jgi:hypothetical protein
MPDLWMPGAARHSLGNAGAMSGGPARAVWHITSNATDWTFGRELGWFTGGGASVAPHLLWDPFTGEIAQFFPADSRSLSLQNAGDIRVNRTGAYCVQIETVFTAGETVGGRRYATVRDTPCKGLPGIMAWLRGLGIPDTWPGGPPASFARDTVPMDTWTGHGGHYGHHQIPGNSHVDPGPMPDLFAPAPATARPTVSVTHVAAAARRDPGLPQGGTTHPDEVRRVEAALRAEGLLPAAYASDGSFGSKTVLAYAAWQRHLGYVGAAADGIPGKTSLTKLGQRHGFTITP